MSEARDEVAVVPDGVRTALVTLAAQVLGAMEQVDVPVPLRQVYRFAPRRRASAGALPLWAALDRDDAFRHQVATVWSHARPALAEALAATDGSVPGGEPAVDPEVLAVRARALQDAGPVEAAVGAWLLRPAGWPAVVTRAAGVEDAARVARADDADLARLRTRAERAEADLARVTTELALARVAAAAAGDEAGVLRREARRLRADADRARAEGRRLLEEATAKRAAAERVLEEAQARAFGAAELVRRTEDDQQSARVLRHVDRDLASVRIRLLLDTLVDAGAALRDELALPPAGAHPADLVAPPEPPAPAPRRSSRGRSTDDPALLDELLALPQAHLVVDGYNVTKTGYPELSLEEQRRRLVDALAHVAGRTGAEVTCCFDGRDIGWAPSPRTRAVRVLFSSGEIADDLIRRIVSAEPPGRVVVVASSDQQVAHDVQAMGAYSVSARAVVDRLGRL